MKFSIGDSVRLKFDKTVNGKAVSKGTEGTVLDTYSLSSSYKVMFPIVSGRVQESNLEAAN